jgi:Rrf2 family protein
MPGGCPDRMIVRRWAAKMQRTQKSLASYVVINRVTFVAVNTQFSIAVHITAGLGYDCRTDHTSSHLARSVNTSPSFVRRVLSKLSKAGLIDTAKGKAGACWLARDPDKISLLDIYEAVEAPKAFAIHRYPVQKSCPVSRGIKSSLQKALKRTQKSMEASLANISLADVIADVKKA